MFWPSMKVVVKVLSIGRLGFNNNATIFFIIFSLVFYFPVKNLFSFSFDFRHSYLDYYLGLTL